MATAAALKTRTHQQRVVGKRMKNETPLDLARGSVKIHLDLARGGCQDPLRMGVSRDVMWVLLGRLGVLRRFSECLAGVVWGLLERRSYVSC